MAMAKLRAFQLPKESTKPGNLWDSTLAALATGCYRSRKGWQLNSTAVRSGCFRTIRSILHRKNMHILHAAEDGGTLDKKYLSSHIVAEV